MVTLLLNIPVYLICAAVKQTETEIEIQIEIDQFYNHSLTTSLADHNLNTNSETLI